MITQELLSYITTELAKGMPKEVVRSNLLLNGWRTEDVDEGFLAAMPKKEEIIESKPISPVMQVKPNIDESPVIFTKPIVKEEPIILEKPIIESAPITPKIEIKINPSIEKPAPVIPITKVMPTSQKEVSETPIYRQTPNINEIRSAVNETSKVSIQEKQNDQDQVKIYEEQSSTEKVKTGRSNVFKIVGILIAGFLLLGIGGYYYAKINGLLGTSNAPVVVEPVVCTQDAMLCPDGETYVTRSGPNCEFEACPVPPKFLENTAKIKMVKAVDLAKSYFDDSLLVFISTTKPINADGEVTCLPPDTESGWNYVFYSPKTKKISNVYFCTDNGELVNYDFPNSETYTTEISQTPAIDGDFIDSNLVSEIANVLIEKWQISNPAVYISLSNTDAKLLNISEGPNSVLVWAIYIDGIINNDNVSIAAYVDARTGNLLKEDEPINKRITQ